MIRKYKSEQVELQTHMLEDFHRLMLEALRQREQDVIRYIAILAPALVGYVWLLMNRSADDKIFVTGTLSVIFLLLLGAVYTVALGYNYRYITLQLAKLETLIDIRDFILVAWPRDANEFAEKYGGWCSPPEVLRVFWWAFWGAIAGVTISTAIHIESLCSVIIVFGILAFIVALLSPAYFGKKLKQKCEEEGGWKAIKLASPESNGRSGSE